MPGAAEKAPATAPQSVGKRRAQAGRVVSALPQCPSLEAETAGRGPAREGVWWRLSSEDLPGACGSLVQSVTWPAGWVEHGQGQGTWGLGEAGIWPPT